MTFRWEINQPFIARKVTQEITLKVIMQAIFGFSEGSRCEELRSLLADWLNITASSARSSFIFLKFLQVDLGNWSPWGNFINTKQQIYDLLQAEIEDRRTNPKAQGVTTVLNCR